MVAQAWSERSERNPGFRGVTQIVGPARVLAVFGAPAPNAKREKRDGPGDRENWGNSTFENPLTLCPSHSILEVDSSVEGRAIGGVGTSRRRRAGKEEQT